MGRSTLTNLPDCIAYESGFEQLGQPTLPDQPDLVALQPTCLDLTVVALRPTIPDKPDLAATLQRSKIRAADALARRSDGGAAATVGHPWRPALPHVLDDRSCCTGGRRQGDKRL